MWVEKVWFYFLFLFLFIFSYLHSLHSVMQASTGHMGAYNETVKSTVMVISTLRSPLLQSNCVQTGPLMWVIEFVIETQPGSDLFAVWTYWALGTTVWSIRRGPNFSGIVLLVPKKEGYVLSYLLNLKVKNIIKCL